MIPKKEHSSSTVGDFRHISYCNVFYKVISNCISSRLGEILPSLIDNAQSAFVKGRSMVENIHLVEEIMRVYTKDENITKVHFED